MNEDIQKLIFGKQSLERIVALEPGDEHTEIFTEDTHGVVSSQLVPNAYFILFPYSPGKEAIRLQGDLHYKWGLKYFSDMDFRKAKSFFYKRQNDFYTISNSKENFMVRTGYTYFKGMKYNEPSILSFDIETNGLNMDANSRLFMITNTFRKNGNTTRKLFCFDEYETEGDMIDAWTAWVREINPSILCGHNVTMYDLPFLDHIAYINDTTLALGRDGSDAHFNDYKSKFRKDQTQFQEYSKIKIYGREICDTYMLAIRADTASKRYETYGLKHIIKVEGLEDEDRVFYDASKIKNNIANPEELVKIKAYAIKDADDALKLYDLMIPATFYFTQSVPKSLQEMIEGATGSQLNSLLVRSYLQNGHSIPKASEVFDFPGAISHGIPGIHKNVVAFDVASLYPSCMLQYEIFDRAKDPGAHMLKMLDYFTQERLKNKRLAKETGDRYYRDVEQSGKIGINSSYGLLGAKGLNFNSPQNAAIVTRKGRETLMRAIEWATGKNYNTWKEENGLR